MSDFGPYTVETVSPAGNVETKMRAIGSERMALTNATLLKRGLPGSVCVIKDRTGREVHRF